MPSNPYGETGSGFGQAAPAGAGGTGGTTYTAGPGVSISGSVIEGENGTRVTAAAATSNLSVSSLTLDSAGDVEIEGLIITTGASANYTVQFNGGVPDNAESDPVYVGGGSITRLGFQSNLYLGTQQTLDAANLVFRCRFGAKSGEWQLYEAKAYCDRISSPGAAAVSTVLTCGHFKMSAQITSVSINSSAANSINIGSFIKLRKLGFLA